VKKAFPFCSLFSSLPYNYTKLAMYHETFLETTKNVNIYLKYSPVSGGSTILFLHGYPDTHATWSELMELLKDDYQVACMDLRGAGKSSRPPKRTDYNVREIFKDITSVVQFLNPSGERSIHLVGHDWGSLIGWCYVSDPVCSKQLSSYTGISGPHPSLAKQQMLNSIQKGLGSWDWEEIRKFLRQGTMSWYILFFQLPVFPELLWTLGHVHVWKRMLEAGNVPKEDPMWKYSTEEILQSTIGPIQLYREFIQGEPIPLPEKIEVPCQAIVPVNDFAITPELYENLSDYAVYFRKNFLDANHWVHREQPNQVAQLIRKFIQNL